MRLTRAGKDEIDDFAAAIASNRGPDSPDDSAFSDPEPEGRELPPAADEGDTLLPEEHEASDLAARLAAHVAARRDAAAAAAPPLPMRFGPTTLQPETAAPYDLPGPDDPPAPLPQASEEDGPRHIGTPLGELLVGRGLGSEDQLRDALSTQTESGKRLGNILVELGLLNERTLVDVLAQQLEMEICELSRVDLDRELVALLPEEDARQLCAIPVRRDGARLDVAVADPLSEHLQDQLTAILKVPVRLLFSTRTDVEASINKL